MADMKMKARQEQDGRHENEVRLKHVKKKMTDMKQDGDTKNAFYHSHGQTKHSFKLIYVSIPVLNCERSTIYAVKEIPECDLQKILLASIISNKLKMIYGLYIQQNVLLP